MTQQDWLNQLSQEGYQQLNVVSMPANTDFGQHHHPATTVHVILTGTLTMTDDHGTVTLKPGERFTIPAGTTHHANCGDESFSMIVGTLS